MQQLKNKASKERKHTKRDVKRDVMSGASSWRTIKDKLVYDVQLC